MSTHKNPRYALKVAELSPRSACVKEAALIKAIANGRQWEMDAVVAAIDAVPGHWSNIPHIEVFKHAAMFGRLTLIQDLSKKFGFKKDEHSCPWEIKEAFDTAVIHDHYDIADFCKTLGVNAGYKKHNNQAQQAMYQAIEEGDIKKIDYLVDAGSSPDYHILFAVAQNQKEVIDRLIDTHGANINYVSEGVFTPLQTAVQYGHEDLAVHLLKKGADATKSNSELLHTLADRNYIALMAAVLERGAQPDAQDLEAAMFTGHLEIAQMILDSGVSIHGRNNQPVLLACVSPNPKSAFEFCIASGADVAAALQSLNDDPELYRYGGREKMEEQLKKYIAVVNPPAKNPGMKH